jgi:crotonobetainyl-CoA:carnitine CoA-transferase CaiB-like acyl-CoA transferase
MSKTLKVLELGSGVSAAYASRLLADHGADVVKVEPTEGDITRRMGPFPDEKVDSESSGFFIALNLNKRGVCLDMESRHGRVDLLKLIAWADILVHNYTRRRALELGLDPETLKSKRADLVVLSITPFGITGPYCDYRAEELTVTNAGGWASVCPVTHVDMDLAPLKVAGSPCAMMSGIAGAMTALAAYRDTKQSGVGEYIDFSEQEYVASILEAGIPAYSYQGEIARRYGQRSLIPWRNFEAKDGPVFLVCIEDDQWQRLVAFMGNPDWAELEIFADSVGRTENQDLIHAMVQEFTAELHVEEFYHEAQKHRICVAPVMSFSQISSNEHLRARGFFTTVDHPGIGSLEHMAPAVMTEFGRAPIKCSAPMLGQHTDDIFSNLVASKVVSAGATARMPLAGVRIVDLSWVWAGTFCTMNLSHLGAEVIRVESEARPDFYRRFGPFSPDLEPGLNRAGHFNQWNQGKKSIAVDLSSEQGIEIVKELIACSDIVVQNFATGVMERLGLGYEELKRINSRIILASISGYGQTGPYRKYMGYGPAVGALTGLSDLTGYIDGGPEELGISLPDPTVGITAALAIVSALDRRDQLGAGDHIDVSLWETTTSLAAEAWMQYSMNGTQSERMGNRDPQMSPHGCFPCSGEDEWISIACASEIEWQAFCRVVDPSLLDEASFKTLELRKANEDRLEEIIENWTREHDRWQITEQLQQQGVAAFPTLTCQDIVEDPHLNERGYIERLPHPEVGTWAHAGIPWRLGRRANGIRTAAPCLGADTDTVLTETLGYDNERIAKLHQDGILY